VLQDRLQVCSVGALPHILLGVRERHLFEVADVPEEYYLNAIVAVGDAVVDGSFVLQAHDVDRVMRELGKHAAAEVCEIQGDLGCWHG